MARSLAIALAVIAIVSPVLADPVLRWSPAEPTIDVGGEITLSVMLDDAVVVRTIELYVTYDPAVVTSLSGGPGALFAGLNLFQGFTEVHPQTPGTWHGYCVILGAGIWTTGPGELYRWTLRGAAPGTSAVESVEVTLLPPGGGSYPEATLPGTTVTVHEVVTAAGSDAPRDDVVTVRPNPFNPTTIVGFSCTAHGHGCLEVLDARGRRVATLWSGDTIQGQARWDGLDDAGAAVPSGVYSFVLTGGDGRRTVARGSLIR